MGHLISVELDSDTAKRLLEIIENEAENADKIELCDAIVIALETDDAEDI